MTLCLEERPVFGLLPTPVEPDWNAGARSVAAFEAECFFRFSVSRTTIGAVVGLNSNDDSAGFWEIEHAFQFIRGNVRIMENGAIVGPPSTSVPRGAKYYIVRIGNRVVYCRRLSGTFSGTFYTDPEFPGWQLPGMVLHKSTKPSTGRVFLDSSLYNIGDTITEELAGYVWFPAMEEDPPPGPGAQAGAIANGRMGLAGGAAGGPGAGLGSFALAMGQLGVGGSAEMSAAVSAHGQLRLRGFASGEPLTAFGRGDLRFGGSAAAHWGAELYPVLEGVSGVLGFSGEASGRQVTAAASGQLPFVGFATHFDTPPVGGIAGVFGGVPFDGFALMSEVDADARFVAFFRFDANLDPAVGPDPDPEPDVSASVLEAVNIAAQVQKVLVVKPVDRIRMLDQYRRFSQSAASVVSAMRIGDEVALLLAIALVDALELADPLTVIQAAELLEQAGVVDAVQTARTALTALLDAIRGGDDVYAAVTRSVADSLTVSAAVQSLATYLTLLTDAVEVSTDLELRRLVLVAVTDEVEVDDAAQVQGHYLAELLSSVDVYAMLASSADVAQGWVMNTEKARPVSEYDNFEFTSLAWYRGQLWGTLDDGLYLLEGGDDAGEPIQAALESLLLDFGTGRQKRIRSAYLGYTAQGGLVLKVRAVEGGEMSEHWYAASDVTADAPREGIMEVGQGLRSRYWQFELVNVDGADFEIDHIELYPIMLGRRV